MRADPESPPAPPAQHRRGEPIALRVAALCVLYALVTAMIRCAEGPSLALFLHRLGAESLPWGFLAVALVDIPLAFVYMRISSGVSSRLLLSALAGALAMMLLAGRIISAADEGAGLFLSWLSVTSLGTFITIQWGVMVLDFFTVEESRRAFPVIYAGAHLGNVAAGLVLRHLARPVGSLDLLVAAPASAGALAILVSLVAARIPEGRSVRRGAPMPAGGGASPWHGLGKLGLLAESPLLRTIAASTALMVLLRLSARYCYGSTFEGELGHADEITRFLGTYTIAAGVIGLILQVVATPPLLRWLGIGHVNTGWGLAVVASFLGSAVAPGLWSSAGLRFADQDLKAAIKTPISSMFYEGIRGSRQADARAIILGVVSPLSSVGSSLLLLAVTSANVSAFWIAVSGMAISIPFVVLSHVQGKSYRRALEDRLLDWHRQATGRPDARLDEAVQAALEHGDRRIADIARTISSRR